MFFPVAYGHELHFLFEAAAYVIGIRLFMQGHARFVPESGRIAIAVSAIVGAAIGSKVLYWAQYPAHAFANFPDFELLVGGKTIVGALLGGLIGVELIKRLVQVRESTGDAFAVPLVVGIIVGRIGCFLAGLDDHTYGSPTRLPWGIDFGDGYPRHPTQLYEILFLILLWRVLLAVHSWQLERGDQFRILMTAYLGFRLVVDYLKPPYLEPAIADNIEPQLYGGLFTAIQLACVAGLTYYGKHMPRLIAAGRRGRR